MCEFLLNYVINVCIQNLNRMKAENFEYFRAQFSHEKTSISYDVAISYVSKYTVVAF